MYPISNEGYGRKVTAEITNLRGIDSFIGICGGGTQILYILSKLSQNNSIKTAKIIDTKAEQLSNLEALIDILNSSETESEYETRIRVHFSSHNGEGSYFSLYSDGNELKGAEAHEATNLRMPMLAENINLELMGSII